MKIKKLLAALTALTMAVSFAACGENDETQSGEADGTTAFEENAENDSEEETTAETDAAEEEEDEIIEPTDEILEADLLSKKIQLGKHVLQYPIDLKSLIDAGAEFSDGYHAEEMMDVNAPPTNKSQIQFWFDGKNYGYLDIDSDDETKPLKDWESSPVIITTTASLSELESYKLNNYIHTPDDMNKIYPKGIRLGSSYEDLIAAYGEPTYTSDNTLIYMEPGEGWRYGWKFEILNGVVNSITSREWKWEEVYG